MLIFQGIKFCDQMSWRKKTVKLESVRPLSETLFVPCWPLHVTNQAPDQQQVYKHLLPLGHEHTTTIYISHSIHVWYIYSHLPYFTIKSNQMQVKKSYMDGMGMKSS